MNRKRIGANPIGPSRVRPPHAPLPPEFIGHDVRQDDLETIDYPDDGAAASEAVAAGRVRFAARAGLRGIAVVAAVLTATLLFSALPTTLLDLPEMLGTEGVNEGLFVQVSLRDNKVDPRIEQFLLRIEDIEHCA